jgi:peptidoglycan/xylan/chitin deacetylase (PgdA/CDA1 family)
MAQVRAHRKVRAARAALLAVAAVGIALGGCGGGGGSVAERPGGGKARTATRPREPLRRFVSLAAPAHPAPRTVRVPILTYHRVHEYATELTKSQPDLTVEPADFREQMAALDRAGFRTITERQLFDALYRGRSLPTKPVIVSVDDGYVDDITEILPVLRRHRMVATFYVVTRRVHESGFVNTRQIRALEAAGMDVGAHTRTHASLPALPASALRSEVEGSAADLRAILGHPVYWFAYPYGAFDSRVEQSVRGAGFLLAVTTKGGTTASATAPLEIPRIHVGRDATARSVVALAGG